MKHLYDYFNADEIILVGEFLYVADQNYGLRIFNVSVPSESKIISNLFFEEKSMSPWSYYPHIFAEGNFLYFVKRDEGLRVINITNPLNPFVVSQTGTSDGYRKEKVFCLDGYCYICQGSQGIIIYDVSDPENVVSKGSLDLGYATDIKVIGNFAYVAELTANEGITIVDVSDKSNPFVVNKILMNMVRYLEVVDGYVYAVSTQRLEVADVRNASFPNHIYTSVSGQFEFTDLHDITVDGDFLYIGDERGFTVFNISDRKNPVNITYNEIDYVQLDTFVVKNGLMYVGTSFPLWIINITDKFIYNPKIIFEKNPNEGYDALDAIYHKNDVSEYLYLTSNGLDVLNVDSSKERPRLLHRHNLGTTTDILIENNILYCAANSGVYVFNISNVSESRPPILASSYTASAMYVKKLFVVDDLIYATRQDQGIIILSYSDKSSSTLSKVGEYYTGTRPTGIFVYEDYLYLADGDGTQGNGLKVFNVSNSSNPIFISLIETNAQDVMILDDGKIALVASGNEGLRIINVEDKLNPVPITIVYTEDSRELFYDEKTRMLYISDHYTLKLLDISLLSFPRFLEEIRIYDSEGLDVVDNHIFITDSNQGFRIYEMDLKIFPDPSHFSYFCGETEVVVKARDTTGEIETSFILSRDDYCSGHGECLSNHKCKCDKGYIEDSCEVWTCKEIDFKLVSTVCSGHGRCKALDLCECTWGYEGEFCQTNLIYFTVLAPAATLTSIAGFIFLLIICCCILVCCYLGVFVFIIFLIVCSVVVFKQTKHLRKFKKLKNFDLLLKEQELDDDDSLAHIKISKELFEIKIEEIKTIRIIGEGGSNSVVFLAKWRDDLVAYKCFKTRSLCNSQEDFTEFEREVSILSSLHHPSIISFYGACLAPPRVGILMEYCSKGELFDFLVNFKEKYDTSYPIYQKIRILGEIANALEYIHSRNIIHRDLKCENVLITERESAKLMDFGLSKLMCGITKDQTKRIGTQVYMAPEIVSSESGEYSESADVYSFAILMYVVISENSHPYGKGIFNVELKVAANPDYRPDTSILKNSKILPKEFKWLIRLIKNCWNHDPSSRYTCEELRKLFRSYEEKEEEKGVSNRLSKHYFLPQGEDFESIHGIKKKKSNQSMIFVEGNEGGGDNKNRETVISNLLIKIEKLETENKDLKKNLRKFQSVNQ